jgi:hypothetical protein
MLLVSGDDIDGDTGYGWGSAVAQDIGWLYYRPRMLFAAEVAASGATGTSTGAAYLPAGTYSIYGRTKHAGHGSSTLTFDGSTIATADDTTATGSRCGWTLAAAGWVTINTYAEGVGEGEAATVQGQISMRFGSWAP